MSALDLLLRMPQFDHAISGLLTLLAICSVRFAMVVLLFPPTDSSVLQPMVKTGVVMIFSTYVAYGQPASMIDSLHGSSTRSSRTTPSPPRWRPAPPEPSRRR